jgi:hypothetical protein
MDKIRVAEMNYGNIKIVPRDRRPLSAYVRSGLMDRVHGLSQGGSDNDSTK